MTVTRQRVTSFDVARLAGVSQSAVSRVFSGASAAQKTIDKVRKAAAELGYRPTVLARAMITGKSRIIGLIVANLDNQFYPLALERLSYAPQEKGYHILVFMASNSQDGIGKIIDELMDYQVDGIITASVSMSSELMSRCADAGIPVVMFNRGQDGAGLSAVTSANVAGGGKVAEALVAGGHRRMAHIAGWSGSSTGRDRARGFSEGLAAAGQAPVAVVDGMYKRKVAADLARDLIAREGGADACVKPLTPGNDRPGPYAGTGNDNEWGQRLADLVTRIMNADMTAIETEYDRAAQVEYPGGTTGHGWGPADRFWMGLRAAFPSAAFTIHHVIGRQDPLMPPRAAVRWSLTGTHDGWGAFGTPTDAPVPNSSRIVTRAPPQPASAGGRDEPQPSLTPTAKETRHDTAGNGHPHRPLWRSHTLPHRLHRRPHPGIGSEGKLHHYRRGRHRKPASAHPHP